MAHSKAISYVSGFFINFAICKCLMAPTWNFMTFCIISQGVALAGYQNIVDRFLYSSYKRYCLYVRSSYKFHHLQVPNGTKNGTFVSMSQVEKLGLLG
jgi:hypothetical protein